MLAENSFNGAPALAAWNRVGFFDTGDFVTDGEVGTGATVDDPVTITSIILDDFPANMFAGVDEIDPTPDKIAVGKGQRLVIDPDGNSGGPFEVQIKDFALDPLLTIFFLDPLVLTEPIPDAEDIGFPTGFPIFVGDVSKIQIIGTIPDFDDRGGAVNAGVPNLDIIPEMSDRPEGPFFVPEELVGGLPAGVNMAAAAPVDGRTTSAVMEIPPLPYIRFRVDSGTLNAVFSLGIGKTGQ